MTVAEQVISVFCGVKGYLDDIDLKDVAGFESKIIENVNQKNLRLLSRYKVQENLKRIKKSY